jgi:hypothetical protein
MYNDIVITLMLLPLSIIRNNVINNVNGITVKYASITLLCVHRVTVNNVLLTLLCAEKGLHINVINVKNKALNNVNR